MEMPVSPPLTGDRIVELTVKCKAEGLRLDQFLTQVVGGELSRSVLQRIIENGGVEVNGKKVKDEVQKWHVHDCTFQLVYVLNGWATFEYEGQGQRTIRKGDAILQTPGIKHREIACSEDFEVLEIVSPADFATRIVEAPQAAAAAAE